MLLAVILVGGFLAGLKGITDNNKRRAEEEKIEKFYAMPSISPDSTSVNSLIFGYKTQDFSMLEAVNDSGKNYTKISTLPTNVKFVIPLKNGKQVLYIADTDSGDLGLKLEVKNITPTSGTDEADGKSSVIYTATGGYHIDRLLISENQEWITWYEIKPPEGSASYTHGSDYYRSYKANISQLSSSGSVDPISWTKISDQKAESGTVINLPSIITNNGAVYFDGVVASDYGIHSGFVNESFGTVIARDQYNSKPYLFGQRYLLYTAYDSNNNPKLQGGSSPAAREAVINTNTVKFLDLLDTGKGPITVGLGKQGEQYKHPIYVKGDPDSELVIAVEVYEIQQDGDDKGKIKESQLQLLKYSKSGVEIVKIMDVPKGKTMRVLAANKLPNGEDALILGEENGQLGNLGTGWFVGVSGYQSSLREVQVLNLERMEKIETIRPEVAGYFEFIGVLPKTAGTALAIDRNEKMLSLLPGYGETKNQQLQLATFIPVEPARERGEGKNPRSDCINEWELKGYPNYEACESCPIYVYGDGTQDIRIKPLTPIDELSASPRIVNNEWNFKADKNGILLVNNSERYSKIDFLFPRGKISQPNYGEIIENKDFEQRIKKYAQNLGLKGREVDDVYEFFKPQINESKYILFTTLDDEQSDRILSYEVLPRPDLAKSFMFYVKLLSEKPKTLPSAPIFTSFERSAFSVVSWGGIVE